MLHTVQLKLRLRHMQLVSYFNVIYKIKAKSSDSCIPVFSLVRQLGGRLHGGRH
jgi:hypothetical protein